MMFHLVQVSNGSEGRVASVKEPPLYSLAIVGPLRRISFGDQNVAVRKDVEPSRMIQSSREGVHARSGGGDRG